MVSGLGFRVRKNVGGRLRSSSLSESSALSAVHFLGILSTRRRGVLRAGMSARRCRGRGEGEREQKYSMPFCSAFSTSPRESQELQILPNGRGFFQGGPNMAGYAVLP